MALVRPGREAPETSQASTLLQRQKSGALLPKHRACHKNRFFQGRHTACLLQYIVYIELLPLYIQYIYIYIVWFLCLPGPFVALLPFSFVIGGLMGVTINWNSQNAFGMPFVCVILASQMPSSKASLIQGQQVDGIQQFSLRTISTRMHQSNHIKPQ